MIFINFVDEEDAFRVANQVLFSPSFSFLEARDQRPFIYRYISNNKTVYSLLFLLICSSDKDRSPPAIPERSTPFPPFYDDIPPPPIFDSSYSPSIPPPAPIMSPCPPPRYDSSDDYYERPPYSRPPPPYPEDRRYNYSNHTSHKRTYAPPPMRSSPMHCYPPY